MSKPHIPILGKTIRMAARLRGGSGSALPGLFIEKIDPEFIQRTLAPLLYGVVVVSGTNGKTTTTKMVVKLLESQRIRVFTNRTGSNFTRGVAAALLGDIDLKGNLPADIAVLELDEAHAVHFVRAIAPRYSLLLNVMRDQLDRFGEIDTTAKLLEQIATHTTHAVVLNREDSRVAAIAQTIPNTEVRYFGLNSSLRKLFPNDDELHGIATQHTHSPRQPADVTLDSLEGSHRATFLLGTTPVATTLKLEGIYNIYNAAAALALVRAILEDKVDNPKLLQALSEVTPAFGRGETFTVDGQPLEFVLVKNPSGFRLGLSSFPPTGYATMIAINDNYADGRDMSWLWDVDFTSLHQDGVSLVSGIRAYDMALRLQYDEIAIGFVEPNLKKALRSLLRTSKDKPKRIYCTYTAMLALRRELGTIIPVEAIDT